MINCVKRNMYDPDLKYIAISYRWGDFGEEKVPTPDYAAYLTSGIRHLPSLCQFICRTPEFKEIDYLWIDIISVDQYHHERKKEAILKMNQIYKFASFILAIPDLHCEYLWRNPANAEVLTLLAKHNKLISNEIHYYQQQNPQYSFVKKVKNNIIRHGEFKKVYQFLAYHIDVWSNRTWVISEYQIAKEKYKQYGIPLKYAFRSLLGHSSFVFFSYYFDDDGDVDQQQQQLYITSNENVNYKRKLYYDEVHDAKKLNQFIKEKFMQQSHLEMILNSNTTRNEDRFNAILPLWDKYKHVIKDKDTISKWNITDIISVRVKLYEFMDDLWEKAALLRACSPTYLRNITFPTFASEYDKCYLTLTKKFNYNSDIYEEFEAELLYYLGRYRNENELIQIKQLINEYKINSKPIWHENLIDIQLNHYHHCYSLSVKSKSYFIRDILPENKNFWRKFLSLEQHDVIHEVYIPFITLAISDSIRHLPFYSKRISINLVGNVDKNKWMMAFDSLYRYDADDFCYKDHTFDIY
ncbi:unnamed protein product [Cunninghamella blakesleeana]